MDYCRRCKNRQAYILNSLKSSNYQKLLQIDISLVKLADLFIPQLKFIFTFSSVWFLTPLLLLSYSSNSQALTAHTSGVIQGSAPYLTFDEGRTKAITTDELLAITLSDGSKITPRINSSSSTKPIELPIDGQSFADINMLVPASTNSVSINSLVTRYHYWGDDDGDGEGSGGVKITGSITLRITDSDGQAVNRNDVLDICKSPYKVELSSTDGNISTYYGIPNTNSFKGRKVAYYIKPKASPTVCFVRPNLFWGDRLSAGPADIWNDKKGFLVQSSHPDSYSQNFPTTGADNLYFDFIIGGVDVGQLTWKAVTLGGITATVTNVVASDGWIPNADRRKVVARVKLTGPAASSNQKQSDTPSIISRPSLPQTFELVGKDSRGNVLKYGFQLKKWFVSRNKKDIVSNQESWCNSIGYRLPQTSDLTNEGESGRGAKPSSSYKHYQRRIGAGFLTEWGPLYNYTDVGFGSSFWSSDRKKDLHDNIIYWHEISPTGRSVWKSSVDSTAAVCVFNAL
ncbi:MULTISPECIES: hypothetical protein [unclassified Gilliamella]|uniref:hypothetical protein n=1 Tax=unclassified Gilliamella TaxID=2685620 RepID=UPI00080DDFF8|nr:hypothetical protein [Gilliamella apicola]OCG37336.1 hypothetical protein A9G32_03880 [Gilliamella apicola]OCG49299.1 hypothetical protein A9G26_08790 [Gilliamella apicola]OCG49602.1 hypothetical protein A9G27_03110 [Gilliamella apicola]